MKITVSNFEFIRNPADKKSIIPEKGDAQSSGIKTYGKVMGWIHSHFGSGVELKDSHHVWYVKRGDLQAFAESLGAPKGYDLKQLDLVISSVKVAKKLMIRDLENNPNKSPTELQLKELRSRVNEIIEKKNIVLDYNKNLKIKSDQEIGPAVREWMVKYQAFAKASGLELSEEKEQQVVNNVIADLSSSKNKSLQTYMSYFLDFLTKELTDKLEAKS